MRRWAPTSRRSRTALRTWTGTAYADLGDHPGRARRPGGARRAALPRRRRTRRSACSRWASTRPCSPPRSRPAGGTRCASGPGRCRRSPWCAPAGRSRRSSCCAATGSCWPTSWASTRGRRCGPWRRRCCGSRRPSAPGCAPRFARRRRRGTAAVTAPPSRQGATATDADAGRAAPERIRHPASATASRHRWAVHRRAGRWSAARPSAPSWPRCWRRGGGHARGRARGRRPGHREDAPRRRRARGGRPGGVVSAVGRCSQDDGAPPLWPWYALLDGLGIDRPTELERAADGRGRRPRARLRGAGRPRPRRAGAGPRRNRSCSSSRTCTGPTPAPCEP